MPGASCRGFIWERAGKTLLITVKPGAPRPDQSLADSFHLLQPKLADIALLPH